MLVGFFKKMVIADNIAPLVNNVFNNVDEYTGLAILLAILAFSVQIYCDFSGYSDIAIGSARIMGVRLMENFSRPYFAISIRDFWSRWHISLSSWFRDYLYFPLGGNRKGLLRKNLNVFVVFLISAFWHGANWTFLIWGTLHGVYQIIEESIANRFVKPKANILVNFLKQVSTYVLVCFAWVFFRANTVSDAIILLRNMTRGNDKFSYQYLVSSCKEIGLTISNGSIIFISLLILLIMEIIEEYGKYDCHEKNFLIPQF